jgi:hypothetical protein
LYDSVRGATRALFSNSTDDEVIEAGNYKVLYPMVLLQVDSLEQMVLVKLM